jgi:AraC-like DNA-binding protein
MYLHSDFLARVAEELGTRPQSPFLRGSVLYDPILATLLSRFHECLAGGIRRVEREFFLYEASARLVTQHAEPPVIGRSVGKERPAVAKAKEFIESNCEEDISLSQLAGLVSLSPYYFARAFEKEVGLPPHTYLEGVRIRRARQYLDEGESIASCAFSVGYSDQSHLTRRFKCFTGVTAGEYIRSKSPSKEVARGHGPRNRLQ